MITKQHNHIFYYCILLLLEMLGFLLVLSASGNKDQQMAYIILMAFVYIVWGIVHHALHHDIHAKIVLEYVLMGSFGISIMFFLLH